jgi:hypothetical protein
MNLANEGLEARKKDEEVASKKRKAEDDKNWEGKLHRLFLFLAIHHSPLQRIEISVSTVGVHSPTPTPRKRRKLKWLFLDEFLFSPHTC